MTKLTRYGNQLGVLHDAAARVRSALRTVGPLGGASTNRGPC